MIHRLVLDHLSPPYLVVHVVPRVFHLRVLPAEMTFEELAALARAQVSANRLDAFLVSEHRKRYFVTEAPDGRRPENSPFVMLNHPDAVPVCNLLRTTRPLPPSGELLERGALLACLVDEYDERRESFLRERRQPTPAPCVLGDLTKGGHEASVNELIALTGRQPSGVRLGLERCSVCRWWRGQCLDEIGFSGTLVVPVHCRCDNENSCARCGGALAETRLNGNYYDESTDTVWHVPGFAGLRHACRPERLTTPSSSEQGS